MLVVKNSLLEEINKELEKSGLPVGTVHGEFKKVSDNPARWERVGAGEKSGVPVRHDGEYVLTASGSKDFGEITPEISKRIGRQAGKIRLRIGYHNDNDEKENYGEIHIEREGRLKQLQSAGFENARDFVDFVGKNYNAIYHGGGRSLKISARGKRDFTLFMQLEPSSEGDFYDVKTAMVSRKSYLEKETPLWTKP